VKRKSIEGRGFPRGNEKAEGGIQIHTGARGVEVLHR